MALRGIDYLGLAHPLFPLQDVLRFTPKGIAIGVFDQTFGNVIPRLRRCIKLLEPKAIRVHFAWTNHALQPLKVVRERSKVYEKLAKENPKVTFYLSHTCENDDIFSSESLKRLNLIKRFAPSCIPVNSIGKSPRIRGFVNETHVHRGVANVPVPYIVSNDGKDIFEMDVNLYRSGHRDARIIFFWTNWFNLRDPKDDARGIRPPAPKERTKAPSKSVIRNVCQLVRRK